MFVDKGTWRRRLLGLLPYAVVVVAWRVAWSWQGYGAVGLGLYVDPIGEPWRFLSELVVKWPILLLGQWAAPPADFAMFTSSAQLKVWALAAAVILGALAVAIWPRVRQAPIARFWAAGMLLGAVPIASTFPSDRLLFFVGLGAMGLLGLFLQAVFAPKGTPGVQPSASVRLVAYALVFVHVVAAPVLLVLRSAYPAGPESTTRQLHVQMPLDARVEQQDVIIVNAPSAAHALYLSAMRALDDKPVPRRTRVLAPAVPYVDVHRRDARTLEVRPAGGWMRFVFDRLFRDDRNPMHVGEKVQLTGMEVEVTGLTSDGRPAEAVFTFDVPLEDESLRWLRYRDGAFVPWTPPAVGETVRLEGKWPA